MGYSTYFPNAIDNKYRKISHESFSGQDLFVVALLALRQSEYFMMSGIGPERRRC